MSNRPRARGAKEPSGRTKAAILLFLARHGESTFTDVREYLLEKYNIRSAKDIRIHLVDLSDDNKLGLIIKTPNGNGNACSYKVREGFNDLKRLFNYLQAQGAGPELMQTKIFIEFTSSKKLLQTSPTQCNEQRPDGLLQMPGQGRVYCPAQGQYGTHPPGAQRSFDNLDRKSRKTGQV